MLTPTEKSTAETVRAIDWWTGSLFRLTITRPPEYRFVPGQFSRLALEDPEADPSAVWRAYSITSAPDDDHLEYYGITVPGGAFTGAVVRLQPGDPILLERAPSGFLTIDRFSGGESLWMLATGTGLGPFIAILRDAAVWLRFRRLVLVHCVRHAREFAYSNILDQLAEAFQANPDAARLQVLRSVTRDAGDGRAGAVVPLQGRITTLLDDGRLETAAGVALLPDTARVMLCGNPAMIEDTRRLLHKRGFLPVRRATGGHFLTENYW